VETLYRVDPDGDSPQSALCGRVPVYPGDLILLMTDGISDNLHESEICALASLWVSPAESCQMWGDDSRSTDPKVVARAIVKSAKRRSLSSVSLRPFSWDHGPSCGYPRNDKRGHEKNTTNKGGKRDDISIVAFWLKPNSNNGNQRQEDHWSHIPCSYSGNGDAAQYISPLECTTHSKTQKNTSTSK